MNPLQLLLNQFPPDFSNIHTVTAGQMYVALQLTNGNIGVCARLDYEFPPDILKVRAINLSEPSHRILLIAYYNALLNPRAAYSSQGDIFSEIDFSKTGPIVMVGNFRPLLKKFDDASIDVAVFDLKQDDARLKPYSEIYSYLADATDVILTSTSLVNDTFSEMISRIGAGTKVYMLGPSTILHKTMFQFNPVISLSGMIFPAQTSEVIKVIAGNGGTPEFSKYACKVSIHRK